MILVQSSPTLLSFCILMVFLLGVAILTWGKSLPGKGSWIIWASVLILLTGIGLDSGLFFKEPFAVKVWTSGWVWARGELGSILVGVSQDALGLSMVTLAILMMAVLTINSQFITNQVHPARTNAALAISTAGVAASWIAYTPWLAFGGLILTLLGGFISLGSHWESNRGAAIAARFIWERSAGFLLAFLGACILATTQPGLLLDNSTFWLNPGISGSTAWVGSILLVLGLFVQFQPFPLLGWIVSDTENYLPYKTLLNQLFPAWAAMALLIRLQPQFEHLGLFPAFGWVALASAIMTMITGLFQREWRQSLATWVSAGFSVCCALLSFGGPLSAVSFFIGISLAAMTLSTAACSFESNPSESQPLGQRSVWVKTACFFAMASGTGVIGFVSAMGGIRALIESLDQPGIAVVFTVLFFSFALLGWKLVWNIIRINQLSDASWVTIFSLFLWLIFSLGFVWTGTVSGEVILGSPDRLIPSLFHEFFGAAAGEIKSFDNYLPASGLYWSALVIAFITAYWTSGRKEDRWNNLAEAFPKSSRFFSKGYQVDEATQKLFQGVIWLGQISEMAIDRKIWTQWIPLGLTHGIRVTAARVQKFDAKLIHFIGNILRILVEIPAKILQLVQTGDLRWYLFFALGSGFALLAHYLRK